MALPVRSQSHHIPQWGKYVLVDNKFGLVDRVATRRAAAWTSSWIITLVLMLSGCAGTQPPGSNVAGSVVLTVSVEAIAEVSTFIGDVEEIAYSYTLRPQGDENVFVAIGHDAQCPAGGAVAAQFRVSIVRRLVPIGLRQGQTEALISDLQIASCEKLDVR